MGTWLALTKSVIPRDFNEVQQIRLWLNELLGVQKPVKRVLIKFVPIFRGWHIKMSKGEILDWLSKTIEDRIKYIFSYLLGRSKWRQADGRRVRELSLYPWVILYLNDACISHCPSVM